MNPNPGVHGAGVAGGGPAGLVKATAAGPQPPNAPSEEPATGGVSGIGEPKKEGVRGIGRSLPSASTNRSGEFEMPPWTARASSRNSGAAGI
jgi:hypothetical protein